MAAPIRKYNVVRKDETPNGVFWRKIGTLAEWEDGSMRLNLFMFPESYHVFVDDEQARTARAERKTEQAATVPTNQERSHEQETAARQDQVSDFPFQHPGSEAVPAPARRGVGRRSARR